jgi:hypothetical protein
MDFPSIYIYEHHYLRKIMHLLRRLVPQEEASELRFSINSASSSIFWTTFSGRDRDHDF